MSTPVRAETLKEALTAAYLFNPTLKSARAQLRAADNQVSLAKSGYRPTISAQFQYGYENQRTVTGAAGQGSIPICSTTIAFDGTCAGGFTSFPVSAFTGSAGTGTSTPRQGTISLQENVFDG